MVDRDPLPLLDFGLIRCSAAPPDVRGRVERRVAGDHRCPHAGAPLLPVLSRPSRRPRLLRIGATAGDGWLVLTNPAFRPPSVHGLAEARAIPASRRLSKLIEDVFGRTARSRALPRTTSAVAASTRRRLNERPSLSVNPSRW